MHRLLRFTKNHTNDLAALLRPKLIHGLKHETGCRIYELVRLRVVDGGTCHLGSNVVIERFCEVTAGGGVLRIGNNSFLGQGSVIVCRAQIYIGDDCLIAEGVTIRDQNHKIGPKILTRHSGFEVASISIGNNVWIGAKACILAGVTIGEGSIIGAGSVVTRSIPAKVIAAGNPARILKQISE